MNFQYKGWDLGRALFGSQRCVARKQGVTIRAESFETLRTMIDLRQSVRDNQHENFKHAVLYGQAI